MSMIRVVRIHIIAGILVLGSSILAQGQPFEITRVHDGPSYYFDIVTSASDDSGFVDLRFYHKIAYDELQFVRTDDGLYKARYELTLAVYDEDGDQVDSRIKEKSVEVVTYDETNATDRFNLGDAMFRLKSGTYSMTMRLMDQDSKQVSAHKLDLKLPDYWRSDLTMSDLTLADTVMTNPDGGLNTVPNVLWNFGMSQKQLYLVFDVYSGKEWQTIPIQLRIISGKKIVRKVKNNIQRKGFRSRVVMTLPRDDLKPGQYQLEITVGKGKHLDRRLKNLTARWLDMPAYALDLDKAIDQLKYIAKPGVIKKIKKAQGEDKRRLFLEYWKSVDPTPGTEVNELMDEYYTRVQFAAQNFGTKGEGWNTDRGMVYIILGAPSDIERHPFEMDAKPYEVWVYYQINRQFIFIDDTGFGDYRLVSSFWDALNGL